MKTQISALINGSENTIRNISSEKYIQNPIGFFSGKQNVPQFGGTSAVERKRISKIVSDENPGSLLILANGVELLLPRHNSASGKSWRWEEAISAEQFTKITGKDAPEWVHVGAKNQYGIVIYDNCTVEVFATSGRKGVNFVLGEEFIEIL